MKLQLRKFFWVFNLATLAICAYLAASAFTAWLASSLPQPKRRMRLSSAVPAGVSKPSVRDVTRILERNIFCSTCEPEQEVAAQATDDPDEAVSNERTQSSLKLRLIATMVSPHSPEFSYAALHDPDEDKTAMFSVGSKLAENATVEEILERRVNLRNGNRLEYIELAAAGEGDSGAPAQPRVVPPRPSKTGRGMPKAFEGMDKSVRKLSDNKWEIQRTALNKVLGNTHLLARMARIVPSVKKGKPNGFKLYAIRPGSIYSLIGLQNGDTIASINGHEITTPDKALEVYTKVRTASYLKINFSRRGQSKTHDYIIR